MQAGIRFAGWVAAGLAVLPTGLSAQTPATSSPPTLTQPGATAPAARPTLIPEPGDPSNVDEVVLPAKSALIVPGQSTWDDGFKTIRKAFATLESEIARLGLVPAGRPLVLYTQTTDNDFRFEAMLPVAAPPAGPGATLPPGMRFGTTPAGKAWRFVHKGAYDEVDTTYETITTYLDAKDIVAKDSFMEEFVNDVADAADIALELNIFVQPK